MTRGSKNEGKVVRCNKKRMWLNTVLVCICSVALLACASKQQKDSGEVSDQVTETMAVANTETASNAETETASATEQVAENVEPTATESSVHQTVIKETGDLDVEGRMLQINGKMYYATSEIGPMGDAGCVAGHIETTVAAGENPQKDGESNFDCVGNPYTYDSGDGSIQVFMEDDNYYWFHSDERIEWKEFTKFVVTNGNNGEQQECTASTDSDSSYMKVQQAIENLHLWDIPEDGRVGYPYCLRTYDDAGNVLQTITIYEDTINFDGDLYKEAREGCIKDLYEAVEALYVK